MLAITAGTPIQNLYGVPVAYAFFVEMLPTTSAAAGVIVYTGPNAGALGQYSAAQAPAVPNPARFGFP